IRAARTAASSRAALPIRGSRLARPAGDGASAVDLAGSMGHLLLRASAKSAYPALVRHQRLFQVGLAEVRPEGGRAVELRVGTLPEQEIAQPHLARGSDAQVGIGET